jgi:hypothetical protein
MKLVSATPLSNLRVDKNQMHDHLENIFSSATIQSVNNITPEALTINQSRHITL